MFPDHNPSTSVLVSGSEVFLLVSSKHWFWSLVSSVQKSAGLWTSVLLPSSLSPGNSSRQTDPVQSSSDCCRGLRRLRR